MNDQERYHRYLAGREWGLKKEAVRRRCMGVCERCRYFPMSHVHHLTYIRKYNELLEDLQGLCVGCHEFTHGKSDRDPKLDVPIRVCGRAIGVVYLAGKITGDNWRDKIVENLSVVRLGSFEDVEDFGHKWPVHHGGIVLNDGRNLDYAGPYRVTESGHSNGWAKHAFGQDHDPASLYNAVTSPEVPRFCCESIDRSDLIFAWVDSLDCYGTLVEVGYAAASGKLILVAGPRFFPELWFIYSLASRVTFVFGDAADGFEAMVGRGAGLHFADWRRMQSDPECGLDPIDGRYWEEDQYGPDDDYEPGPADDFLIPDAQIPDDSIPFFPPEVEPNQGGGVS